MKLVWTLAWSAVASAAFFAGCVTPGKNDKGRKAPQIVPVCGTCEDARRAKEAAERTILMYVTAYCPCEKCCGKYADGFTSLGDDARICDGVAADPRLIPYRTKLRIPGVGIREVDDTGGRMRQSAKKGSYHIDVRFASHEEAKRFGRKWLKVKIITTTERQKGKRQ